MTTIVHKLNDLRFYWCVERQSRLYFICFNTNELFPNIKNSFRNINKSFRKIIKLLN